MDLGGPEPFQNEPRGDQNQSLEAKRPKVRPKSGPSAEKIKKKIKNPKIARPGAQQGLRGFAEKCNGGVRGHPGGVPPPHKYLSKLR